MAWQQLTLRITASELPETEALLRLAGAASVAISDESGAPILEPPPGSTPLWPDLTVRALFDSNRDLRNIGAVLGRAVSPDRDIELLDDEDLANASRQVIRPVRIGPRLTIVPAEDFPADARADTLGLHMGLAFGTGQHPTTRLCLEWLEREVRGAETVLDYGCGTGILALAALKLGAARATAIDNEPQALDATRANAALNGLESGIVIAPPERLGEASFDIILANILAQPLIELARSFAARQTPGARIVLSGLIVPQLDLVEAAYVPFYEPTDRRELSGWGLLIAERSEYDR